MKNLKYFEKSSLLLLSVYLFISNNIYGYDTHAGGDVSGTWTAGTTHYISATITIPDNATLTIEAGCVVKFAPGTQITIYGTIDANGTSGSNVIFTCKDDDTYGEAIIGSDGFPSAGDWYGIYTYGGGDYEGIGQFDYCRVSYGGNTSSSFDANIYFGSGDWNGSNFTNSICEYSAFYGMNIYNTSPTVLSSYFNNNSNHGIYATAGYIPSTGPSITDNTFTNNGGYGAYLYNILMSAYSGNTGSGNGTNGFGVSGSVSSNLSWSPGSNTFPIILIGTVTIDDNVTLTIPAGTIIKAISTGEFYVYGTLAVNGSELSMVTITSINDDAYGGDTQGDGASTGSAGDWYGIYLNGSGSENDGVGNFDYCRIRYGGNTSTSYDANIYFYKGEFNGSNITNSVCEYGGYYGIRVFETSPTITGNTINNNTNHGIFVSADFAASAQPTITNNTFTSNGQYGAYLQGINTSSYSGNIGTGNGINGFGVSGWVTENQTWSNGSVSFPIILTGQVYINDGCTLILSEGTIIKAAGTGEFYVYGTLDINGTVSNYVTITSLKDDNYGGDTNVDGATSSAASGDWYGIVLNGSGDNDGFGYFDYCRIRYGGSTSTSYKANLYFTQGGWSGCHFDNSICEYSGYHGINIYDTTPTISNSTISNNNYHGIYASASYVPNTHPYITDNIFNNNSQYGVYLDGVEIDSYTGNTGSGNGTNEFGVRGDVNHSNNWSSGNSTFPISLINTVSIKSGIMLTITGGNLRCKTNIINNLSTDGTFTLNSGATLEIGSTTGITSSGSSGNIRTTTRNFSSSANYIYNGTAGQVTGNGLPGSVNNFEINNSAGVTLSSSTTINGTLYLTNGTLNNSTNNFTIADGKTISRSGGNLSALPVAGSTINLEYTGVDGITTANEVPEITTAINNFMMNCSGGLTLSEDIQIPGTLTLTNGNISTGANTLIIGSGVASPGSVLRTGGIVVGNLRRWFAAATVSDVVFPIGTLNYYRPANIGFTPAPTSGGTITCLFTSSNPGTNGLPINDGGTEIVNCASEGYWTLTAGDGLTGGTYNLDLTADGFSGINDYSTLRILKRNTGGNWTSSGSHSAGTGSNSTPIIHRTGLNGFSEFGIGSGSDNPLPTELISFTATTEQNKVVLKWQTATEVNNYGFEVERSVILSPTSRTKNLLPQDWQNIGFIEGSGNSNSTKEYSFMDKEVVTGTYFYRLKQIDTDGSYSYSDIVEVTCDTQPSNFELFQNYPNPFNPTTVIKYQVPSSQVKPYPGESLQHVSLKIYDILGSEVATLVNEIKEPGVYQVEFDGSKLSSGVYFYKLAAGGLVRTRKLLLLK